MAGAAERTLRAKYLDWCSARLADRFLELTPEETYERSRARIGAAAGAAGAAESGEAADSSAGEDRSYRLLVQRVTDALLEEMSLPTFEQWAAAYREEPSRFDAEMLGFWKDGEEGEESEEGDGSVADSSP